MMIALGIAGAVAIGLGVGHATLGKPKWVGLCWSLGLGTLWAITCLAVSP